MSIVGQIKNRLRSSPLVLATWLYGHDFIRTLKYMDWRKTPQNMYWQKSAELLFQYHKLEKGMCIGGKPRFFGVDALRATSRHLQEWDALGLPKDDPVYLGALETLRAYRARLAQVPAPVDLAPEVEALIEARLAESQPVPSLTTPQPFHPQSEATPEALHSLMLHRRSVRSFSDRPVDMALVRRAFEMAQLSPSACNRQPWRVHLYSDRAKIDEMLSLQNGNAGFGHTVPLLAVVTTDARSFFDATERLQGNLDAGLFLMSFLLGLQAYSISSCCLNWCVNPTLDRRAHERGDIPDHEQIATFLAIGYATEDARVPRSPRRSLNTALLVH